MFIYHFFIINLNYYIVFLAAAYPRSSTKRDYGRREDLPPPRSRVATDYGSRVAPERRPSYRDYPARGPAYSELPRSTSRAAPRRGYVDDGYSQRFERPPPPPPPPPHVSYREGRPRDYDALSGSKRSYAAMVSVISALLVYCFQSYFCYM